MDAAWALITEPVIWRGLALVCVPALLAGVLWVVRRRDMATTGLMLYLMFIFGGAIGWLGRSIFQGNGEADSTSPRRRSEDKGRAATRAGGGTTDGTTGF